MKKSSKRVAMLVLMVFMLAIVAGCGGGGTGDKTTEQAEKINVVSMLSCPAVLPATAPTQETVPFSPSRRSTRPAACLASSLIPLKETANQWLTKP